MIPKNWDAEPSGTQKEWNKVEEQKKRHGSPTFYALLDEAAKTHDSKSHDYASNSSPYGNYHFAGWVSNLFSHSSQDAGFVGRIAEKIYRLANLEKTGKTPKNESVEDTEKDILTITGLWLADRRDRRAPINQSTDSGPNPNFKQSSADSGNNPLQRELFDLIKLMPDSQTDEIIEYIWTLRKIRRQKDN